MYDDEPIRLIDRAFRAWERGELSAASVAETFVRIADSDVDVRPGFVPMSKSPNKDGFTPIRYVETAEELATAAALRRRRLFSRAQGLPKTFERKDTGRVPVSSGKSRDYKARAGERARRVIDHFHVMMDRRLSARRIAEAALRDRELLSAMLSNPESRARMSNAQRKRTYGQMRAAAHRVKMAYRLGILRREP